MKQSLQPMRHVLYHFIAALLLEAVSLLNYFLHSRSERLTISLIARRILCYVKPGDALARGQRYGFIRFGSRVDVYLPADATPRAAVGDIVYAAESVLAEFR